MAANEYTDGLAEIALCLFMLFAGMDDQRRPPNAKQILRLVQILLVYVVFVRSFSRSTELAARQAGWYQSKWGIATQSECSRRGPCGT